MDLHVYFHGERTLAEPFFFRMRRIQQIFCVWHKLDLFLRHVKDSKHFCAVVRFLATNSSHLPK